MSGKRKSAGGRAEEEASPVYPQILVPTPAQLAAGTRIVIAEPETWCNAVRLLVNKAESNGWGAWVSYAHFIAAPPYQGKWTGIPVPTHSQAVRLTRYADGVAAYGIWHGIEGEGWSGHTAQAMWLGVRSLPFGVEVLRDLVLGKMSLTKEHGQGAWRVRAVNSLHSVQPAPDDLRAHGAQRDHAVPVL